MRFKRREFLEHLKHALRAEDFDVYAHRNDLFVVTVNPYCSEAIIREYLVAALLESMTDRDGARTRTEERSLFETPAGAYLEALEGALLVTANLMKKGRINTERGEAIEFRVNMSTIQDVIIRTRITQDVKLVKSLLPEEILLSDHPALSYRFIEKRIKHRTGRAWSKRRIQDVYEKLRGQKLIKLNGNRFTKGANIL